MKKIVKIILLAILMPLWDVSAETKDIVLKLKNKPLEFAIKEIQRQTDYKFFYADRLLDGIYVTVEVSSPSVEEVMKKVLKNTLVKFRISNHTVFLNKEKNEETNGVKGKQQLIVNGVVKSASGESLIGVSISKLGSKSGTVTDMDGEFTLSAEEGSRLKFSYIGFLPQIITVGKDGQPLFVKLEEDSKRLDEVVVVGYGVQRKSDLTSSISKISTEKLSNMPVSNIEMALQGQAAGVNITSSSGRPGAGVQIRIRGVGTINNNEPLYVVDGMPVSDISYLNMSDVESVEILKDASSAAIYGTRAANGVVLVSTKKGRSSQDASLIPMLDVNFEAYYGIANPTKQLTPATANEYLSMVEQIYGKQSTTYASVKQEYDKGYNTNWWKEVNRKNAALQNYTISFSGGNSRASYLLSAAYLSQDGIDRKSSSSRISFRINTDYKVKNWLKIGENISLTNQKIEGGGDTGEDGFVSSALRADPLYPVTDPDKHDRNPLNNYGSSPLTNIKNPVAVQDRYLKNRHGNESLKIVGNAFAEVTFLRDFIFKTDIGLEINNGVFSAFSPVYFLEVDDQNKVANAWSQFDKSLRWTWVNTLNYSKKFGKNNVSAVIGYQAEEYVFQNLEGNKFGQPNNNLEFQWISGGISGDRIGGNRSEDALLSYFGRVNYTYSDRYLLSASLRRDGSSKFATGNRWGTFPSVSAGWRINNEEFFKQLDWDWVSNIKLRLGWGQLGNQRIPSGAYNTFIEGSVNKRFYFNGEEHLQGYGPINAGNPNVSWERTETTNVGADLSFWNAKLNVTFDWFNKNTDGMLMQIPMPDMFGTFAPWENVGKVNNKGWEISADYRDNVNKFSYSVSFNLSSYKNKVVSMGGTKPYVDSAPGSGRIGGYCRTMENEPIGYFYGFKTAGIFQSPREVKAYVDKNGNMIQPEAKMGDFRFVDIDDNGVIDDKDKVKLGSPHPDLYYGFNITLGYAGFDLSATFNGVAGNEIFNAFKYYTHQPLGFANVLSGVPGNAWTVGSEINNQPRMTLEDTNDNFRISDFYVENGSYLRLKNLQIGYTFPKKLNAKLHISNFRVYVSAQNLCTLTKYSGLDPEIATGIDRSNGVDVGVYPQTRVFQLGVNLKF